MHFMVIRKADAQTEAGVLPSAKVIDDMQAYNEKLVRSGQMKDGGGLMASSRGARVSFSNGKPTVIDGPFAEAKELIAGYSIIEAASLAEVVELVKHWPSEDGHGNVQIEIRQLFTVDDLAFSDEQKARYARLEQGAQQQ
jgi:hypothetical protein